MSVQTGNQVTTILASTTPTINTTATITQQPQTVTRILKPGTSLIQPQLVQSNPIASTSAVTTVRTSSGTNPLIGKVLTNSSGQIISLESLLQKQGQNLAPGTTLRVAGTKPGQTSLIQLTGAPGSQIAQYAVVSSQGRNNLISLAPAGPHQQRLITTQASAAGLVNTTLTSNTIKGANTNDLITTTRPATIVQQQSNQAQPQAKLIQANQLQTISAQQLVNAKVLGGNRIKTTATGIRMMNASNLNIAHIGGKPVIIASKQAVAATATGNGPGQQQQQIQHQQQQQPRQNIIWQSAQGNSSGPNTTTNFVIGGQAVKVQGNVLQQFDQQNNSQTQTVMFGNQVVKLQAATSTATTANNQQVHHQNVNSISGVNNLQQQQTSGIKNNSLISGTNNNNNNNARTVVLGTTGQTLRVHSPATQNSLIHGNAGSVQNTVSLTQPQQMVLGQNVKVSNYKLLIFV